MGKGCYALHPPHKSEVANADRVGAYHNSGTQVVVPHSKQTAISWTTRSAEGDLQMAVCTWSHGPTLQYCCTHAKSLAQTHTLI